MQIAILGLGAMGSRVAMRLLRAGHAVTVYNRSRSRIDALVAAGAIHGPTPRLAAVGAEFVISMVRDDDASCSIWCDDSEGALMGLRKDAIAIESSTLTPNWVGELAAQIHATGAAFLDAPVVGSRPQADSGQLIHLVGGDKDVVARAGEIFAAIGGAARHVGPIGAGATLKLAVNTLFGTQVAVLAEMLALLRRSNCDSVVIADVLATLPVTSPAVKGALALIQAQADAPLFPIDLVEKDFTYTLIQASAAALTLPVTAAVHERFVTAKVNGLGGSNITAIARLY